MNTTRLAAATSARRRRPSPTSTTILIDCGRRSYATAHTGGKPRGTKRWTERPTDSDACAAPWPQRRRHVLRQPRRAQPRADDTCTPLRASAADEKYLFREL